MVQSGHGRNAADGAVSTHTLSHKTTTLCKCQSQNQHHHFAQANSTRHSESNVDKPKYFVADAIRIPMSPFQIKISKVVNQLTLDIDTPKHFVLRRIRFPTALHRGTPKGRDIIARPHPYHHPHALLLPS
ncbi:hypothetical protein DAKH74_057280 [Maudiozyma humilis]|uniref:Uncharacterized protein n=1 Tax=Maudiozyma humilis TaxID=51915 RepID=A0AAV5SA69_MAUHU|nr:hypothetical protein DAKH74_057280 [Kazachstania humilis]